MGHTGSVSEWDSGVRERDHLDQCVHPAGLWSSSDLFQPSLCPTQSLLIVHQRWLHNLHDSAQKENMGPLAQIEEKRYS